MEFRETKVFSRQVDQAFSPEEYRALQLHLIARPDAGPVIPGTGGLRKLRWSAQGKGKRGGVRIIYFWLVAKERIYFLLLYAKNEKDDLSAEEKRLLRGLVDGD
jgi:mRNA-degrading endonuclease RelE of RelBE toxin-antitoxin system